MTISAALFAQVTGDAGVAALIKTRLYAEMPPQDAVLPFCVYHLAIAPSEDSLPGLVQLTATADITAVAETYETAFEIAEALRSALSEFRGNLGGSFAVHDIAFANTEGDVYQEPGLYGTVNSFLIQYPA